jgi:hypothetical protein
MVQPTTTGDQRRFPPRVVITWADPSTAIARETRIIVTVTRSASSLLPSFSARTAPSESPTVISFPASNAPWRADSPHANAPTDANCRSTANHEVGEERKVAFRNKGSDSGSLCSVS